MNNHLGMAGINLVLDLRRAGFFYESTRILKSNLSTWFGQNLSPVRGVFFNVDMISSQAGQNDTREASADRGRQESEAFVDASVQFIERWRVLKPLKPLAERRDY
jgi:hypothetical protein